MSKTTLPMFGVIGASALLLALAACSPAAPAPTAGQPTGTSAQPTATAIQPTATTTQSPVPATQTAAVVATTPATGTRDACALATSVEVGAAFGFTVASPAPTSDDNYDNCTYSSADGNAQVTVALSKTAAAFSQYANYKNDSSSTPVTGVGDDAVWANIGLLFTKGSVLVTINANSAARGSEDHYLTAATALGKIIASRM